MFPYKNNNFDLIRLLAALQVAITHSASHLEIYIPALIESFLRIFPGVPIFFFVSGFLISMSFERCHNHFVYASNRFLRIYPALFVCLVISVFTVYFSGYQFSFGQDFFIWFFAQSTIVQFYNPEFFRGYGVGVLNGALWTIPVELSFYLLLPFIYYLGNKLQKVDLVLVVLLSRLGRVKTPSFSWQLLAFSFMVEKYVRGI